MKFLANENFPFPSIQLLKGFGHDIVSVNSDRPSITDEDVVKWANEEGRTILTFDRDYGEIVFRYKIACSVVFFRDKGDSPASAGEMLLKLMNAIKLEGYFTVVDKNGIRQRELKF